MSEASNPFDAYKPPPEAAGMPDPNPSTPQMRGMTKAICIIAIVLGGLGSMTALFSTVGLVLGDKIQQMTAPMGSGGDEQLTQMNTEMYAVQGKFLIANAAMVCLHFVVAILLLIGGIQCLRQTPSGAKLLTMACAIAIPFELIRLVVQTLQQIQIMGVVGRFMPKIVNSSGDAPAGAQDVAMMAAKVGMIIGLVFGGMMVLVKLVYYVWGVLHLRKLKTQAAPDKTQGSY